ncbi:MAG TPA: precorrin-2 C(20)-methyltransferase [Egibacteraceae bacterium]|nr:precorrin-2 C(20)-methyltransferase [Egibacteraceae bacterium]
MTGGTLTGVGVGPGDPQLITLKAISVLAEADEVFVPVASDGRPGYAEQVVAAHLPGDRLRRLVFALGDDPAERDRSWDAAGQAVAEVLRIGAHAAFATIGDPNLYSTFTYLADTVAALAPGTRIATVPGITAMQDLAARSGTVLAEGAQRLALLPFTAGEERLAAALADFDTVIAYKGGRRLPRVRRLIEEAGRIDEAVFGARLGMQREQVSGLAGTPADAAPYLSTVIVTRPRGARGGAL